MLYCGANPQYKSQYVLVTDLTASSELSPFYEGKTYYYIGEFNVRGPHVFQEKYTQNISEKNRQNFYDGSFFTKFIDLRLVKK